MFTLIYKGEPHVIVNISEDGANTALDAIAGLMDGGSLEILSATGNPLAVLKLSSPAAMPAVGSELVLNEIKEEDAALATGTAVSARIVARDGSEVFSCDCGPVDSDAVVRLNPVLITRGAPVKISSFRIAMP